MKKKKSFKDLQEKFAKLKSLLAQIGKTLPDNVGITFDPEKGKVNLTKGQWILKSNISSNAFCQHVDFLEMLLKQAEDLVNEDFNSTKTDDMVRRFLPDRTTMPSQDLTS